MATDLIPDAVVSTPMPIALSAVAEVDLPTAIANEALAEPAIAIEVCPVALLS